MSWCSYPKWHQWKGLKENSPLVPEMGLPWQEWPKRCCKISLWAAGVCHCFLPQQVIVNFFSTFISSHLSPYWLKGSSTKLKREVIHFGVSTPYNCLIYLSKKKCSLILNLNHHWHKDICFCPIICYLVEETDPLLSTASFQVALDRNKNLLSLLFSRHYPSPSAALHDIYAPDSSPASLPFSGYVQPFNVLPEFRGPELNTEFEVRPHQCQVQGDNFPRPAGPCF